MLSSSQAFISQNVGCRDYGEISSVYTDFALGDSRRSLRLWVVSKEGNSEAAEIAKQFVGDYIPYEQDLSSIAGNAKQVALEKNLALLAGSRNLWYIFLPPGFYVYIVDGTTGKLRQIGESRFLTLRYSDVSFLHDFHLLITSEQLRGERGLLSKVLEPSVLERRLTDVIAERYSLSGPIGLLSKNARGMVTSQNRPATMAYVSSDRGQVRKTNEDCGSVVTVSFANGQGTSRFALTGVADGVGGLAAGEIASKIAISAGMSETIYRLLRDGNVDPPAAFVSAFDRANEEIMKVSSYTGKSMASTLSIGMVKAGRVWTANAGDTRIYGIKPNSSRIQQLTMDHRLEKEGPQSHVITRSLGSHDHTPDVSDNFNMEDGDFLLSCSDGLHDLLDDSEILERTQHRQTPREICSDLTAQANSRGGKDNITIATLLWKGKLDG